MKITIILFFAFLYGFNIQIQAQESSGKLKIALWPLNNLNDPRIKTIGDQVIKPLRNDLEKSLFDLRYESSRPYDVIDREIYQKVEERWIDEILLKFPGQTEIKEEYAILYLKEELPIVDAVFFYEITEIQSDYLLYVKGLNISKETTTLLATSTVQLKKKDVSNSDNRQNKVKSLTKELVKQLSKHKQTNKPSSDSTIIIGGGLRSLAPGLGQFYKEQYKKGWIFIGAEAILFSTALISLDYSNSAHNKALNASTQKERDYYNDLSSDRRAISNVSWILLGITHVVNMIDGFSNVEISSPRNSNSDLRSSYLHMGNKNAFLITFRLDF